MAENSKIAWTNHTFNPWIGCTKVSPGCAHCYAENLMDVRYGKAQWGPNGTRVRTSDANWRKPLKWNRDAEKSGVRARVFCASLADVFEDWKGPIVDAQGNPLATFGGGYRPALPGDAHCIAMMDDIRRDLFSLIDATPYLDWLLLTKRPENIRRMWHPRIVDIDGAKIEGRRHNVWLGTSVENQEMAEERIPHLLGRRDLAPVLWLSVEPMLGPIDFRNGAALCDYLSWVVFGGESSQGKPARPCNVAWIRDGVRQCLAAGVRPFVKQLGSSPRWSEAEIWAGHAGRIIRDKAGSDPAEWPEDLRVREFPNCREETE